MGRLRGVHRAIVFSEAGVPSIRGYKCLKCGARVIEKKLACPACGARQSSEPYEVSRSGTLHSYSIVHRSFPGIETPFISAVVDMSDGTVLKGNLRNVKPDPSEIHFGMPISLSFDKVPATDKQGNTYVSYFFDPAETEAST